MDMKKLSIYTLAVASMIGTLGSRKPFANYGRKWRDFRKI